MTKFTQEIIDLICDHLESSLDVKSSPVVESVPEGKGLTRLAHYAILSRQWKAAVQRKTFASLQVFLQHVGEFLAYVGSDNARYVREVHFHLERLSPFPHSDGEIGYPYYGQDINRWTAFYQMGLLAQLTTVMKHISEWEIERPIFFSISGTYLRFDEKSPLDFPIVKNIREFSSNIKNLNPVNICRLATRMPELRKFRFVIPNHTKRQNSKLADEIATWGEKLPHLDSLEILGENDAFKRQDPRFPVEDMRNEAGVDRLCQELRLLSQKKGFKSLEIEHVPISRELFEDTQNPKAKMSWPTLEGITILLHERSSTGEWFITGSGHPSGLRHELNKAAVDAVCQSFLTMDSVESPALGPSFMRNGW